MCKLILERKLTSVSVQLQPLEGSVSQENFRGEAENQVFIFSQKGLSFSGGISSSKVDMFELSVFLHTSSIYIKTAGTTVWHQSKIQWQNDPSCVLRFLGGKLQRQVSPDVRCSGPVRTAPPQTLTGFLQLYILKQWPPKRGRTPGCTLDEMTVVLLLLFFM